MGAISKGHTFSDGDTVTAAKLNNLVDNATLNNDAITGAMIADSAISSNHLAAGAVSGASLSSNTVALTALSNASSGSSGTIIQSGTGGAFQELTLGAAGTILKVGSGNLAEWGTVDSSGVGVDMISGHAVLSSPGLDDEVLVKEKSGVNKRVECQNLLKVVSGLTAISSSDVASDDEFLMIDGGLPRKITKSELSSALNTTVDSVAFARAKVSFSDMNDGAAGTATLSESNNIGSVSLDFTNSHYTLATLSFNSTASSVPTPIITAATARAVSGDTQSWYREVWVHSISTTQLVIAVPGTSDVDASEDDFVFYVAATL